MRNFFAIAFKYILDFTAAVNRGCMAAVERHPGLHYNVDFIILFLWINDSIVKFWNH